MKNTQYLSGNDELQKLMNNIMLKKIKVSTELQ